MEYRQIVAGPFYGLFAIHYRLESSGVNQQEVVDKLDKAEALFGLVPGKRFFVLNVLGAVDADTTIDVAALLGLIRARGYFVILVTPGDFYPGFAKAADHVTAAVSKSHWLNFPAHSIVATDIVHGEPELKDYNRGVSKFALYDLPNAIQMMELTGKLNYGWAFQPKDVFTAGVRLG